MLNELLQVHRDWLKHETHGVNAMLALVPKDAALEAKLPTPAVRSITTESEDELTAMGLVPHDVPGLMLTAEVGEVSDDQQVQDVGDGVISLMIRYAVRSSEAAVGTRWAGYALRAVTWSLRRLYHDPVPESAAARSRNGIDFYQMTAITWVPTWQQISDVHVTCTLKLTVWYRDTGLAAPTP